MGSFKIPKKSIVLEAKEYVLITLGLIIYAFGWVFFLLPFKLVSGGTAGIGAIIQYATGFPSGRACFFWRSSRTPIRLTE